MPRGKYLSFEEAFSAIKGLPQAALEAFTALSSAQGNLEKLLYDPPYKHQSDAIRRVPTETFIPIKGEFAWRPHAAPGTKRDAEVFAGIDLDKFNGAESEEERALLTKPLLQHRGAQDSGNLEADPTKDFAALDFDGKIGNLQHGVTASRRWSP